MQSGTFAGFVLLAVLPASISLFVFLIILSFATDDAFGDNEFDKKSIKLLKVLAIIWIVIAGGTIPTGIVLSQQEKYNSYSNHQYNIISLDSGTELDARFCLGSGYIDTDRYYYFYTETNHGYKLESIRSDYTYLVEKNDIEPSLYRCKDSGEVDVYYVIYCPEGTIIREFKV